ncbi:MAG: (d)CMP kinase [Actinomycetota bacterium]|nr:(d)CMP kinase [Actinomycetota bacterium]
MSDLERHVVAIDGPSGTGKSTVARAVADALDLNVLDTGAMYRAVTFAVLDRGLDPNDGDACTRVAVDARIEVERGVTTLDGRDVSAEIRTPEVTATVSAVSAHPPVREVLVARQRSWVEAHGGGVVEGRDIGTVVFPGAVVKVYLDADDAERARRRHRDEQAAAREVAVDDVREALTRRDQLDSTRAASPLLAAEDAVVIDTTDRAVADVVAEIVARYRAAEGG